MTADVSVVVGLDFLKNKRGSHGVQGCDCDQFAYIPATSMSCVCCGPFAAQHVKVDKFSNGVFPNVSKNRIAAERYTNSYLNVKTNDSESLDN